MFPDDELFEEVPRNSQELVALFEMFLFMRVPDMGEGIQESVPANARISKKGNELLSRSHVLNRIFRAWYQITWLDRPWHRDFYGETPRQELGRETSDIRTGHAMLSVSLGMTDPAHPIVLPRMFDRSVLDTHGGAYSFGIFSLAQEPDAPVVAPNFDPDFRAFAKELEFLRRSRGSGEEVWDDAQYMELFLSNVGTRVLAPFADGVDEKVLRTCVEEVSDTFLSHVRSPQTVQDAYVLYDEVSDGVWRVLRHLDKDLMPRDELFHDEEDDVTESTYKKRSRDPQYAHAMTVFNTLHYTFDRDVLFPLDRYFNALEIVWQDRDTFVANLATLFYLLNHNLKYTLRRIPKGDLVGHALRESGFDERAFKIENLWFNPMTAFRVLEATRERLGW